MRHSCPPAIVGDGQNELTTISEQGDPMMVGYSDLVLKAQPDDHAVARQSRGKSKRLTT
jgi:hypothetical protein